MIGNDSSNEIGSIFNRRNSLLRKVVNNWFGDNTVTHALANVARQNDNCNLMTTHKINRLTIRRIRQHQINNSNLVATFIFVKKAFGIGVTLSDIDLQTSQLADCLRELAHGERAVLNQQNPGL